MDLRMGIEERHGILDGEVQDVGDVETLETDFQGLPVVSASPAGLAFHEDVGKEVHLDSTDALSLAGLAASALHVEAESAGFVAADLRFGRHAEQLADFVEDPGVGRGIRSWRSPDGGLIDVHDAVDPLEAVHPGVGSRDDLGAGDRPLGGLEQDFIHQGTLATAGNAGDTDDASERERRIDGTQVVRRRPLDHQGFSRVE